MTVRSMLRGLSLIYATKSLLGKLMSSRKWLSGVVMGTAWLVSLAPCVGKAIASSGVPAPAWGVTVAGVPSLLPAGVGHHGRVIVIAENTGGSNSEGDEVVRDVLPQGLTVTTVLSTTPEESACTGNGTREVTCTFPESVASGAFIDVYIEFEETSPLPGGSLLRNITAVGGGGGQQAVSENQISVQTAGEHGHGPAGIAHFSTSATGTSGEREAQAGGHPDLLTTSVLFNNMYLEGIPAPVKPVEAVKDLVFYLPIGMLGNPTVAAQCPSSLVESGGELSDCPPGSQLGTILPLVVSAAFGRERAIYNIVPDKGDAAEFAFGSNGFTFISYANVVRHNETYMVRVATPGIPSASALIGLVASFDGDVKEQFTRSEIPFTFDHGAFLTDPTDCEEDQSAREATVAIDTVEHPDAALPIRASSNVFPSLAGCGALSFAAGLGVTPETKKADSPSGYEVGLEVPQAPNDFSGLGTPPVRKARVTLPVGTTVSPSSANGLGSCAETGPHGINIEGAESNEVAEDGLERPAAGHCPLASEIATVNASTPLLREELKGHIFLATPTCGGENEASCTSGDAEDGKLIGLYLELEGPNSGVIVKLKGHATIKQGSGQLTTSFDEIPQFPFRKFVVATKRGAHAPLENSQSCGTGMSSATLTPWSPETRDVTPTDAFTVDWNGEGQPCPAVAPFAPSFTAGTTSPTAAATSPFELTMKREDREQDPKALTATLPEGLLANISKVTRCPEPQASQDSLAACPASSQIGTTTVAVGPGSDPYYETGKVFFTGPYGGAPFGLSVVVPAVAGPFNLGDVLVRARLFVDPHTSQATAVSNPLPQELDGIPLRMRVLNITLTNEEFVLNPTSCQKMSINATVTSTAGGTANLSSPFIAKGCNKLRFKPAFSASTEAKSTKANGTGVKLKIAYASTGEANIAKTVLGFPKQLPVRLETLQKACPAATFEANPASCPVASNVGTATVHTPILSLPLTGPIYLVSYGSAKFPDAVVVLQGEGLTLDVDGQSFVSKAGALTATFASVPDAPFSTFEASLPAGRYSQFTSVRSVGRAQGSQCGENLVVPVTLVAHNDAELKENAAMQIAGCPLSVSILKTKVAGARLAVTVKTSAKGRLTILGAGLKTLVKPGLAAGTHKLTIALTAAGRAAARAHGKIGLTVGLVVGAHKTANHKRVAL